MLAAIAALTSAVLWLAVAWYRGPFTDEGDNLAVGRLLADGWVLYRDVFSHHHPLPYWLSAGLSPLLGESVFAYRATVLVVIALGIAAIGAIREWRLAALLLAAAYLSASMTVGGTFFTFSTLAAPAVGVIFAYTLRALLSESPPRGAAAAIGIAGTAATLLDPLLAPFVLGSLLALGALRQSRRLAAQSAVVIATAAAIVASYLLVTDSLGAYVDGVFRFNQEVYAKWHPLGDLGWTRGITLLATALDLFSTLPGTWSHDFWDLASFDRSLTGGLGMRLTMLAAAIVFLVRRRSRAAVYVYVSSAVLLATNHEWNFHALPALFVALAAVLFAAGPPLRSPARFPFADLRLAVPALLLLALVPWQRSALAALQVMPANPWAEVRARAQATAAAAARQGVDRVASYPDDLYLYFFERLRPLDRYMFLTPWVAEVAMPSVLHAIRAERGLVRLDPEGSVWGVRVEEFVRPLTEGCATDCCFIEEDLYLTGPACAVASSRDER